MTSVSDSIIDAIPVTWEWDMLITILRSLRIARYIRASNVVKTSSIINWYWLLQRINPAWYWRRLCGESRRMSSRQLANDVDMQGAATSRGAKDIRGMFKKILRTIGIVKIDDEDIRRDLAVTRIQKAWRARMNRERAQGPTHETYAWAPSHEFNVNPAENVRKSKTFRKSLGSQTNALGSMAVRRTRMSAGNRRQESQVGSAMRELTGQRVAIGIILALILTVLFTYTEGDATRSSTMIVLHEQTKYLTYANASVHDAHSSSIPDLYRYVFADGESITLPLEEDYTVEDLRDKEIMQITVQGPSRKTIGYFDNRQQQKYSAVVEILSTIFILLVWYFGVSAFAGPVICLVVNPIERMVRLLGMLMKDPLGYQSTARYKKFVSEDDELTKNTRWTKEVLKGMETSFLMSTILRIGSLMKVGFGSAGVEIIRSSLQRGQSKNVLNLDSKGSSVSCIFLFCDIRQFTDATECLQEEVFVFTNRIAAVVHSICHSYGGSANKNVGDAFLLSWLLEDESSKQDGKSRVRRGSSNAFYGHNSQNTDTFTAKHNQADKALLTVVKICMALHHDKFYIETMSDNARDALLAKVSKRKGPVVQMGFGLHAGKAVQGAIGSQRKIDATYVSESVELAEFLESSTKKYGVKLLMSDSFHRLLHPSNRRRCRKVDQILLQNNEDESGGYEEGDVMELFTFDMDIDALWGNAPKKSTDNLETNSDTDNESSKASKGDGLEKKNSAFLSNYSRRRSMNRMKGAGGEGRNSEELRPINSVAEAAAAVAASVASGASSTDFGHTDEQPARRLKSHDLVLPTGPTLYNANVWLNEDMRNIREKFSKDFPFFQKFNSGLQSFYAREW
eukprot:CAMPEP_0194219518 /NCGR_PEP_ID=MMETSP0156-20130528/26170_1 /TAXON_ID=33649 /ORGANISM="Thalassionema nitzschioides, Strain L26-B" /LENGTH=849 /DNA_ID=CAMNT_0038949213 /DNA_START=500 /DNA_END=3046 /DNA_ORIENTATION=-